MTPEEFRTAAHTLVDWLVDHRLRVEDRRVRPDLSPGDVIAQLPSSPPTSPEAADAVLADLAALIAPAITEVQHPMHFGWFPSNASLASVLGDVASSGIGSLGISWESSPAITELETVVVDWLRQLTGLSDAWHGVIQDTASTACLVSLLAAREQATDHAQAGGGLRSYGKALHVYATAQAHSSVRKAALLAGYAADDLRVVNADPWTRDMDPDHLSALIAEDIAAGGVPAAVVASAGSTGVTAFDPLRPIAEIAQEANVWLHVDAAMAGSAMLLPEYRHLFDGVELADAVSWNPHKWMGTILDTSLLYLRDPEHLIRVMSTNPSYLQSTSGDEATQYRDWGIPLGRRFRALKLWFHLRIDGIEAIQQRLRRDLDNAQWFAEQVAALPHWSVVAPVRLQTVCLRHAPPQMESEQAVSEHNHAWVRSLNESGDAFLSPAMLDGQWMVRVSVGVESTERSHLERLLVLMQQHAAASAAAQP